MCCTVFVAAQQGTVAAEGDAKSQIETQRAATDDLASAALPASETAFNSQTINVPEVLVEDARETNLPDQEAVKDIPGAVNVVTREEIQRARPKNADEMLRRIPGINIQEEYGQGLRPNIGIRGLIRLGVEMCLCWSMTFQSNPPCSAIRPCTT